VASDDYIVKVLQEITVGLLARPRRVNWDLVGDLSVTLAAQNEALRHGPRYGELPDRLLDAYNARRGKGDYVALASALSTTSWRCWADVETLVRDVGARVLDLSSAWKLDYTAVARTLRWKAGMRDVIWHAHANRDYARVEFMWPSGYRTSGGRAFNSTRTRDASLVVQWNDALTPFLAELERAFDWYGFPTEGGAYMAPPGRRAYVGQSAGGRLVHEGFYDNTWSWAVQQGWFHALGLYYYLPYICKGAALVFSAANDAMMLLEPSRRSPPRGQPVLMGQEHLMEWLAHRGWDVDDRRAAVAEAQPSAPPRDISIMASPRRHNYVLSIQAGADMHSVPGDEEGTAERVEIAAWRGRITDPDDRRDHAWGEAQPRRFLPLRGNDTVPAVTFTELAAIVERLERGAI